MSPTVFPEIGIGTLATLLDLVGAPSDRSPRHEFGEPQPLDLWQSAVLAAGDVLDDRDELTPEFRAAAKVVLDPHTIIDCRAWDARGGHVEARVLFPGPPARGGGTSCNGTGGAIRMTAPITIGDVLDYVTPLTATLPTGEPGVTIEAHLPTVAARLLGASLDGATDPVAACQVAPEDLSPLRVADIVAIVTGQLAPDPDPPTELLAASELAPSGVVDGVAALLAPAQGGIRWRRHSWPESGRLVWSDRTWLAGVQGLIIEVAPTLEGMVSIRTVTAEQVVDAISGDLTIADLDPDEPPT